MEAGQAEFVLPVIQGFVGQREFTVDKTVVASQAITDVVSEPKDMQASGDTGDSDPPTPKPEPAELKSNTEKFLLTLISRRSVHRPGLRYLRRGIDQEGFVANSVETEQILAPTQWIPGPGEKLYSFVQYRGSMPIFFSQSPYSLKPVPVPAGTPDANSAAFKLHFQHLQDRYGDVQVANLVEKRGPESRVGDVFQQHAEQFNKTSGDSDKINFEWFDFHSVCKGMRFDKVSLLFDILKPTLDDYGWTEQTEEGLVNRQAGVLRTNCMDCLDRTNVVQSACGRTILEKQLADQGITIDLEKDTSTSWFNTLWADNGDNISRQYAGTAALKGDFTRTRKRNISGALTDFGLTLSRYYNNIVNDYFAQAVIDFLLGRANVSIFSDFEADMKAQDYAIDLRSVRLNAVSTCSKICIEDPSEKLLSGWVLRTPEQSGTLRGQLEESVLLLTERALYFCRMDWTTEKVKSFDKIELSQVEGLIRGAYITSTFAKRDMDEKKNIGFLLRYSTLPGQDMTRVNTRSLSIAAEDLKDAKGGREKSSNDNKDGRSKTDEYKMLAFKTLPPSSNYVTSSEADDGDSQTDELTKTITNEITRLTNAKRLGIPVVDLTDSDVAETSGLVKVEEKDIISLADAKRSTTYMESLGYSLKKFVWAS